MESSLSSPDSVESRRREFLTRSPSPTPVAPGSQLPNFAVPPAALSLAARGKGVLFVDGGLPPNKAAGLSSDGDAGGAQLLEGGAWEEVRRSHPGQRRNPLRRR